MSNPQIDRRRIDQEMAAAHKAIGDLMKQANDLASKEGHQATMAIVAAINANTAVAMNAQVLTLELSAPPDIDGGGEDE